VEDAFDRVGQLIHVNRTLTPVFPVPEWSDSLPSQQLNENGPSPRASSGSADTNAACDGAAGNYSNTHVSPSELGDGCGVAAFTQLVDGLCSPSQSQGLQLVDTPASKRSWADISDEDTCLFSELPLLTQICAKSVDLEDPVQEHVINSLDAKEEEKTTSCNS